VVAAAAAAAAARTVVARRAQDGRWSGRMEEAAIGAGVEGWVWERSGGKPSRIDSLSVSPVAFFPLALFRALFRKRY